MLAAGFEFLIPFFRLVFYPCCTWGKGRLQEWVNEGSGGDLGKVS